MFVVSLIGAAYMGFSLVELGTHDKIIHFLTFLILTSEFYFIFNVSTHSLLRLLRVVTLGVCTIGASVFLELVQNVLNPKRVFDVYDILYNVIGSFTGLLLVSVFDIYRMKKRRRNRVRIVEIELEESITNPTPSENSDYHDYINVRMNDPSKVTTSV